MEIPAVSSVFVVFLFFVDSCVVAVFNFKDMNRRDPRLSFVVALY